MEELLKRMAKQLNSLDEASLVNLRDKYVRIVDKFEPTEKWQEATLILSLIQAKMWQNQLFNYHWSKRTKLQGREGSLAPIFSLGLEKQARQEEQELKERKVAKEIAFSRPPEK